MQANRLAMLAQQRQMEQDDALRAFLGENAPALASNDPAQRQNVLARLAGMGPQSAQFAIPLLQQERDSQQLQGALGSLGLGGVSASPGAPATAPAPGGSSMPGLSPVAQRLIPDQHRAPDSAVALDPGHLRERLAQRLGLSSAQAAGIVSGLHGESGLRPGIVRPGGADYGLAQWVGPRRDALFQFAAAQGRPAYDPEVQIAFLEREIQQNPRILANLRAAPDATAAANAFHPFLSGGAPQLAHTLPLHVRAANQMASAQPGASLVVGGSGGGSEPRAIPTAAGAAGASGGGGMDPAAAQRMGQGLTSDQFLRFVGAVAGNPRGMQVAQAIAPFVRQGEATEIRELGAQNGRPAGLYVINRGTGQPLNYIGPAPNTQGTQTDRDEQAYMELDARRGSLTTDEQQRLALIERRLTTPQTIVGQDGSIRTIQPPPLPRRDQMQPAPGAIPVSAPGAAPAAGPADAQPLNPTRQQTTTTPGGQTVTTVQEPRLQPDTPLRGMLENANNLRQAQQALRLITEQPSAVGLVPGALNLLPVDVLNRTDPDGTRARAAIAAIGAQRVHDMSGAAVTLSEYPRLRPFIPQVGDDTQTVRTKLARFVEEYQNILRDQYRSYGPENQFRAVPQIEELLAPQSAGPGGRGTAEPPPPQGQRPPLSSFNGRR